MNKALAKTHIKLSENYKTVSHINSNDLVNMEEDRYRIFDVRQANEFAISHIKNAIRVDPDIDAESFLKKFEKQIADKTIILYCSVGVRSSQLAERLINSKASAHVAQIYNLENGIFGWHNENLPLFQNGSVTNFVHPYNRRWGRMVNRKSLRRYKLGKN